MMMNKSRCVVPRLEEIRASMTDLIKMTGDAEGALEYLAGREQVLESARHLLACLDPMIRDAKAS